MDCSPPGSSIYGIFQARVLEYGAIAFSTLTSEPPYFPSSTLEHNSCWQIFSGHLLVIILVTSLGTNEKIERRMKASVYPQIIFSPVQSLSHIWLCNPVDCSTPGFPVHQFPELAQTNVHQVGDATQPSHLLPCPFPPAFSLSQHQGLSNESVLSIRWPKYWSFSISSSSEYSGLISFRMDWLDLLAVQGTLKNLLQHHSSKALILQCSTFFIVKLSHPYITTGKTIALTRWTFVGQVMSLLFNMLSR